MHAYNCISDGGRQDCFKAHLHSRSDAGDFSGRVVGWWTTAV